ncbi:hypothetical protein V6N11_022541 [Hibiscus sabdariffa]|uniref:Uncharacterized protein n=1 Tax=Hibiscus sabdariffa TaxID=183260 RepID=A0ABR2TJU9_9ROSI
MVRHSWAGDASEIEEKKAHIFARKQKNPSKTLLQLPPACIKRSGHPPGVLVGVIGQGFSFWCNGEAKSKKSAFPRCLLPGPCDVCYCSEAHGYKHFGNNEKPCFVQYQLSNQAHSISLDWRSDLHVILYIAVGIIIHKIIARR